MRILVISNNPFSKTLNNGKTLASFFQSVSSNDLAQLYANTSQIPDTDRCKHYYRITEKDILKSFCDLSFLVQNSHTDLPLSNCESNVSCGDSKLVEFVKNNKVNFAVLREVLWQFNTWDTGDFNNWIREFNPQVIFCVLGNIISFHKICVKLAERYHLPLVVFFTDDYIINDTSTNFIQRWHYRKLCKAYEKTMEKADLVYVIGDKMKVDYQEKYGRKMDTLVNCVDFSAFSKIKQVRLDKNREIYISFIGGFHLNRWIMIARFGKIIQELNQSLKLRIKIKVFSIYKPEDQILDVFNKNGIEYEGSLNQQGVIEEINKSHFLLHVESFDVQNRLYTRYSVSTKIPEYLASKRRIIVFGPHEIASLLLLNDPPFGCCLTDLDTEDAMKCKLIEAIDTYNDFDYQSQYQYAFDKFDQVKVAENLLKDMQYFIDGK